MEATKERRTESPLAVRTRFHGQFICIQDLQAQLYRDANFAERDGTKEYILALADRLGRLRD